ncbi:MAG TPA: SRPBCC domain-containing protein [Gammaproteobacteria bacterium]|jgi:uncharacterized protein YndB with AHSA1/START domain|nr:SRPBCC domain-containing protein [Gammaproteobacteria bacterium]
MVARNKQAAPAVPDLTLVRTFDAPVSLVFQCWTEPRHIVHWLAPHGFAIPHAEGELRPGGSWRSCMRKPDGTELWLGGTYREVVKDRLLVFTHAWDDPDGTSGHETVVTVRFDDLGGRTQITFHQAPFVDDRDRDGHAGGWNECFERLQTYLKDGARP